MELKIKTLSWLRTIRLLIKLRFDLKKARAETDRELMEAACDVILGVTAGGDEKRN